MSDRGRTSFTASRFRLTPGEPATKTFRQQPSSMSFPSILVYTRSETTMSSSRNSCPQWSCSYARSLIISLAEEIHYWNTLAPQWSVIVTLYLWSWWIELNSKLGGIRSLTLQVSKDRLTKANTPVVTVRMFHIPTWPEASGTRLENPFREHVPDVHCLSPWLTKNSILNIFLVPSYDWTFVLCRVKSIGWFLIILFVLVSLLTFLSSFYNASQHESYVHPYCRLGYVTMPVRCGGPSMRAALLVPHRSTFKRRFSRAMKNQRLRCLKLKDLS